MPSEFDWESATLSPEDQALIDAYESIGRPLDNLAYSDAFDDLVKELGWEPTKPNLRKAYLRLLNLRKRGQLPRIYPSARDEETNESASA